MRGVIGARCDVYSRACEAGGLACSGLMQCEVSRELHRPGLGVCLASGHFAVLGSLIAAAGRGVRWLHERGA